MNQLQHVAGQAGEGESRPAWRLGRGVRNLLFGRPREESQPLVLSEQELTKLRCLSADVRNLQDLVGRIRRGDASLETYGAYLRANMAEIFKCKADLQALQQKPDLCDRVRRIANLLDQMKVSPLLCPEQPIPDPPLDAQAQMHLLNVLAEQSRELIFHTSVLTIPNRVNQWLRNARPGYYVPFHAVFDEELPTPEDRAKVLDYMAWQPKTIAGGLVNPANGLIYKYALSHEWKAISFLMLVAAIEWIIVGLVRGPYYLAQIGFAMPHAEPVTASYLVVWAAVVAGVVFHIVVAAAKRLREQPDKPPIFALGTLFPIINAYIGLNLFKLLLTLIGFFGAIFTVGGDPDQVTLLNAFLIGYSLDSVVELFGVNVERLGASQVATLKKQLEGAPG